jgi:hypothetical protein
MTNKKNHDWCSKTPDMSGYKSDHNTGICLDVIGRGSKRDYCRYVNDKFVACDINSTGDYSYWFRSKTKDDGLPELEVPYSKSFKDRRVDSYCGVVPPTKTIPAKALCLDVKGAGFSSSMHQDPDPPEQARIRIAAYESLNEWFPLKFPEDASLIGAFKSQSSNSTLKSIPRTRLPESIKIWRGNPYLMPVGKKLPINESNCISLVFKPDSNDINSSEQMILFSGDGPYINEFSIVYNPVVREAILRIYDGKYLTLKCSIPNIVRDKWNHVFFQHKDGKWEGWLFDNKVVSKDSAKHPFARRNIEFLGKSPEEHTASNFSGSIKDIRFYKKARSLLMIKAIIKDN